MAPATSGRARWKTWSAALLVAAAITQAGAFAEPVGAAQTERRSAMRPPSRVRKSVTALTAHERRQFVRAVLALKAAPSPYDATLSYYDQFVAWHLALYPCGMDHDMIRAHGGPVFLPWHRLFLLHFENALREVSGTRVTVPYWDWTDPAATAAVFADDLMGGDGDPDHGFAVTTGPFRKGRWPLSIQPVGLQWGPSATTHLTRRFGSFPLVPDLPSPGDVAFVMRRPRYDVAPYDGGSDPNRSFRNALEGFWRQAGPLRLAAGSQSMVCGPDGVMWATAGETMHNGVHAWVGGLLGVGPNGPRLGTMFLPTSPNDPVFFLHHANVDRLWAQWQDVRGPSSFEPSSHGGPMHPPFTATPDDVADVRAIGYRYDTQGRSSVLAGPAATDSSLWCELPVVSAVLTRGPLAEDA
jgi:tyrosinase